MTSTTAPAFTHSRDCTANAIACALENVRDALRESLYDANELPNSPLDLLEYIEQTARGYQAYGIVSCDCRKRELGRLNEELRIARKRQRAFNGDARLYNADYAARRAAELADTVTELMEQRAAIRAEIAR